MNIDKIYDYILYISNKDEKSGDVAPEKFNLVLEAVNLELFEEEWEKLMALLKMSGTSVEVVLSNNSPLNTFSVLEEEKNIVDTIDRYDDFVKLLTMTMTFPEIKPVEMVNEHELSRRRAGVADKPIEHYPVCVVRHDAIYIYPTFPTNTKPFYTIEIVYLRMPATPIYDYCIKSNDDLIYMAPDWYVTPSDVDGQFDLYNDQSIIVATNVSYPNYVADPSPSLSTEIEWPEDAMNTFINRIFEKVGLPLSQADMQQYSQIEQQKGE